MAHKSQLIFIGISIPKIIAVILRMKDKDAIKALWEKPKGEMKGEIELGNMYFSKWSETVTDEFWVQSVTKSIPTVSVPSDHKNKS